MIAFIHTSIVEITTALIIVTEKVKTHILKFFPLAFKNIFYIFIYPLLIQYLFFIIQDILSHISKVQESLQNTIKWWHNE